MYQDEIGPDEASMRTVLRLPASASIDTSLSSENAGHHRLRPIEEEQIEGLSRSFQYSAFLRVIYRSSRSIPQRNSYGDEARGGAVDVLLPKAKPVVPRREFALIHEAEKRQEAKSEGTASSYLTREDACNERHTVTMIQFSADSGKGPQRRQVSLTARPIQHIRARSRANQFVAMRRSPIQANCPGVE